MSPFFLLSISVAALSGRPSASAQVYVTLKRQNAAFAPLPVTAQRVASFFFVFFLQSTTCQQFITITRIRLFYSDKDTVMCAHGEV